MKRKQRTCPAEGCERAGYYGTSYGTSYYCRDHKSEDMVNMCHPVCAHEGCGSVCPCYATPGSKRGTHCMRHALEGMEDVRNRRCKAEGCASLNPSFGNPGDRLGTFCGRHMAEGMVDVTHRKCASEWCDRRAYKRRYDGHCALCFAHLFPDRQVARNFRTKERAVTEALQERYPDFTWVADMRVSGGCSSRRPDLACDFGSHVVVVEVDEHRHQGYSCENRRIMELFRDFGCRPIVFVRFNPDAYGTTPGCWAPGRDGVLRVKHPRDWAARLERLAEAVDVAAKRPPSREVTTVELFFV